MDLQYTMFERFIQRIFFKKWITIKEEQPEDCTLIRETDSLPTGLKEQIDGTYILTVADGAKYKIDIDSEDCLIYDDSIVFPSGSGTQFIIGVAR